MGNSIESIALTISMRPFVQIDKILCKSYCWEAAIWLRMTIGHTVVKVIITVKFRTCDLTFQGNHSLVRVSSMYFQCTNICTYSIFFKGKTTSRNLQLKYNIIHLIGANVFLIYYCCIIFGKKP